MSAIQHTSGFAARTAQDRFVLSAFVGTIFLSAFLLFSVQPMFAKMVLPILGGSPSVWSVAMVFFQSMLLAGYAFAHLVVSRFGRTAAVAAQMVTLMAAVTMLPLGIDPAVGRPPDIGQAFWLLAVFAISIGLPFFAVSVNAPLLQAWFSRTGHPHASDPYFLYAASNVGSFLALISYPFLVEPFIGVSVQAAIWSGGFVALAAGILTCGAIMLRARRSAVEIETIASVETFDDAPSAGRMLHWLALAAVPSGLLVAVTAHISTDVASAPFLWLPPLALFLATFVIVFRQKPLLAVSTMGRLQPIAVAALIAAMSVPNELTVQLLVHLASFTISTLVCHGELARLRPSARHLTRFYLVMSAGGALGGLFAGLLAPMLFDTVAEYPMLIIAALAFNPALWREGTSAAARLLIVFTMAAVALLGERFGFRGGSGNFSSQGMAILFLVSLATYAVARGHRSFVTGLAACLAFVPATAVGSADGVVSVRSFYGAHRVVDDREKGVRLLLHGTTLHGIVPLNEPAGRGPTPTTYYAENGPLWQTIQARRERLGGTIPSVGIVGLGGGAMACNAAPGEAWTFFEIDPEVVALAQDADLFPFLASCTPDARIVVGDARLTLQDEMPNSFDALVIDAFTSDAIPAHLLTVEAMALYKSRLKDDGVIAFHISNRHMELASVVADIAAASGFVTFTQHQAIAASEWVYPHATSSSVAVMVRDPAQLPVLASDERWQRLSPTGSSRWTDDHSNGLAAVWRRYTKR